MPRPTNKRRHPSSLRPPRTTSPREEPARDGGYHPQPTDGPVLRHGKRARGLRQGTDRKIPARMSLAEVGRRVTEATRLPPHDPQQRRQGAVPSFPPPLSASLSPVRRTPQSGTLRPCPESSPSSPPRPEHGSFPAIRQARRHERKHEPHAEAAASGSGHPRPQRGFQRSPMARERLAGLHEAVSPRTPSNHQGTPGPRAFWVHARDSLESLQLSRRPDEGFDGR